MSFHSRTLESFSWKKCQQWSGQCWDSRVRIGHPNQTSQLVKRKNQAKQKKRGWKGCRKEQIGSTKKLQIHRNSLILSEEKTLPALTSWCVQSCWCAGLLSGICQRMSRFHCLVGRTTLPLESYFLADSRVPSTILGHHDHGVACPGQWRQENRWLEWSTISSGCMHWEPE